MKRLVFLLAFMIPVGVSANASTVGLTPSEEDNLLLVSATGAPTFVDTGINGYTVSWDQTVNGVNTANIGITFGVPRGMAGDTFEVTVTNRDESAWDFAISLDGVLTPFTTISTASQNTFSVLITGPCTDFALVVRGDLPLPPSADRTAEFKIVSLLGGTPVPEPASMLLLGAGLMGLGATVRRFRR